MRQLYEVVDFVRETRRRLRFGELSRSPMQILRLAFSGDSVELDWMLRPADLWDFDLSPPARNECASRQAVADAMAIRSLVLDELPSIRSAVLRGFRTGEHDALQLIVFGVITRDDPYLLRVASPVMRAKLCGFQFELENGVLKTLKSNEGSLPIE